MKLQQLVCFQTVCKHQNITRAAAELHLSQPRLSHVIQELEEEFGLTLFLRQSKGLVLTEDGKRFSEEAALLLEHAEEFTARMRLLSEAAQTVDVGIPPASGALFFAPVLQNLARRSPRLRVNVHENGSLANRQNVLDGKLDAAFVSTQQPPGGRLGCYRIATVDIRCYASVHSPLAREKSVTLARLHAVPLALLTADSFLTSHFLDACRRQGLRPNVVVHTNQLALLRRFVEENTAVTVLFGGSLPKSELYAELPIEGSRPADVFLVWNRANPLTAPQKQFIRVVKNTFPQKEAPTIE